MTLARPARSYSSSERDCLADSLGLQSQAWHVSERKHTAIANEASLLASLAPLFDPLTRGWHGMKPQLLKETPRPASFWPRRLIGWMGRQAFARQNAPGYRPRLPNPISPALEEIEDDSFRNTYAFR